MPNLPVVIDVVVSAPFLENTLIVRRDGAAECVVVDPGFEPQRIFAALERLKLEPVLILLTHGHADHIAGNSALKRRWPSLPIVIGERDAVMLTDAVANLSGLAGIAVTSPPADRLVREGDVIKAAGLRCEVFDIPGHSPGHVVYVLKDESPVIVLGGDVLFEGSIGRTDFPGGDFDLLVSGIRRKLFTLPDDTQVYPGHGELTTIGVERRTNPFCGESSSPD
jgi:glyoxylase-like metal-dependent hydrolase (beta-lactamase superfamily II)